jgi:hypothetical protein
MTPKGEKAMFKPRLTVVKERPGDGLPDSPLSPDELAAEVDEAYQQVGERHVEAWEAHCRVARVERHRLDLEYAAGHPVLAWFQWDARRRMAQFERSMIAEGTVGPWQGASSLPRVRQLEARAKVEAKALWDELVEAEQGWEQLHGRLGKPVA